MPVDEALAKRRFVRTFSDRHLSLEQVSQLLWAANGTNDPTQRLRTAPSAGGLYPIEVYLVDNTGVYHYLPVEHALDPVKKGDLRAGLSPRGAEAGSVAQAPVTLVVRQCFERTTQKYEQRGIQYVHYEVGHVGQNVLLEAVRSVLLPCRWGRSMNPPCTRHSDCLERPPTAVPDTRGIQEIA